MKNLPVMLGVEVSKQTREIVGSCNACSSDDIHRIVFVVRIGVVVIRICHKHKEELIAKIRRLT